MQKYFRIFYVIFLTQFLNIETIFPKDKPGTKIKEVNHVDTAHYSSKKEKSKKNRKQENYEFEIIKKKEALFFFSIQTRKFAQGELLFLKLIPKKTVLSKLDRIKIIWEKKEIPHTMSDFILYAWIPVSPEFNKKSGILEIHNKSLFRKNDYKEYEIPIHKTNFSETKISSLMIDKKYTSEELSQETLNFIAACSQAKAKAFQSKTDLQIVSDFIYPVQEVHFTSPFYKRRIYNKTKGKPHGGVDFKGAVGTPIYAINDGTVILSRPMYYEGNLTVIDHGLEVYSLYMHQSELNVKVGDKVKKGSQIGKVGSTGMSTGPHLHLGLRVQGTMVDPLSVIGQKFFD
ncbi:M23 family metallopeptidase [Leptospira borgpetersenii]|uniref:Metallopeptidase n=2 Tax=Leptospira borgpetersenii TaxID=174 RepID=Q04P06_LEPBJ|nr:M23 family metallopeptidase [Leptospira borgpetersenii]ABJ77364.1 Metallopeptidase [Leptospira borgpetersenii serovar Hardjo-bovis str. JB197]AMX72649.1 membrane protein [Leptospira borgpetersenii serovar Hardjo]TQE55499.1 M23 family metallopeptidase [Leptospira borgpetersenii]